MNIRCPYCGHGMGLKDTKPGKYKPKCGKCEKRFLLTLPADPAQAPVVQTSEDPNLTQFASDATFAPGRKPPSAEATVAHSHGTSPGIAPPSQAAQRTLAAGKTLPPQSPTPDAAKPNSSKSGGTKAGATQQPTNREKPATPAAQSNPAPSKSGRLHIRDITKSGNVEATLGANEASPDDLTAAPPEETPRPAAPGTQLGMDATVIIPQKKPAGIPEMLGGYKLVRELGRGAMGAVYLAKQLSLDRNVALKLIQAKWASNPVFIARFTREAYAAAQLTHHNVVQIYDLGCQGDINYYTMEFVTGSSLAQLVQKQGKLDAEAAVGYVLQAARGLNFAHMHGMVHRDVKPANLMLNEQGVVKVADLGLVKTPHLVEETGEAATPGSSIGGMGSSLSAATAEVTMANIAMGTPAYMAPEQATNAAGVDHRADIYSLGCTLYVLLTGRPPFEGASALEVITKHRTEPIMRPEAIVKRIPPELSNIVLKMVAKRPDDRFQNMNDVIRALEGFLGVQSSGPFSPREEHAQTLEASLDQFNNAALVKVRDFGMMAFIAGCAAMFVILLLSFNFQKFQYAVALLTMGITAVTSYFLAAGIVERSYLYEKVRSYFFSQRLGEWITTVGSALAGVLAISMLDLFRGYILGGGLLGGAIGVAFYYAIDRQLAASRKTSLANMEGLLKMLRLKGVEEAAIEQFVVKYTGDHWEEFFEALFGYEAKMRARTELSRSEQGRRRRKFATWRDGIIRSIDAKLHADQEARDRKHLQKVEEENLVAQGVKPEEAKAEAELMADVQIGVANEFRATPTAATMTSPELLMENDPKVIAAQKRDRQLKMLAEARGAKKKHWTDSPLMQSLAGPLGFTFGAKVRFFTGVLLLAIFTYWLNDNGVFQSLNTEAGKIADAALLNDENENNEQTTPSPEKASDPKVNKIPPGILNIVTQVVMRPEELKPVFFLPSRMSHVGLGVAGAVMLLLGMFRGWKMSIFAWPAAIIALFMPSFGIGYAIAAGLAVAGLLVGRTMD